MNTVDIIVVVLIAAILGGALWYLYRARKKGVKCIGCPDGAKCSGSCAGCTGNCGSCSQKHE